MVSVCLFLDKEQGQVMKGCTWSIGTSCYNQYLYSLPQCINFKEEIITKISLMVGMNSRKGAGQPFS